jgi:hypothetical protein
MPIGASEIRAVTLVLAAALACDAKGDEAPRPVGVVAGTPVVAIRGEAVRDAKEREAAVRRVLAEAATLTETTKPSDTKRSERDTKPESVEVSLTGPAGGVRLSVRGQLPSGFLYTRGDEAGVDSASCGGAAALTTVPKADQPTLDSEVQP